MPIEWEGPTGPQINFIEILANDLELNRAQKYSLISEIVGRTIRTIDQVTKKEASDIIQKFKDMK